MRIKNRWNWNLVIDGLMLVDMALIAGIGFLMKYTLPPGRERVLRYGENTDLYFLGIDRHQWGGIHLWAAYVLLGLLVLHVVLHWDMVLCLLRKAVPRRTVRSAIWAGLTIVSAGFLVFAFLVRPTRTVRSDHLYRNAPAVRGGSEAPLPSSSAEAEGAGGLVGEDPGRGRAGRQAGPEAPGDDADPQSHEREARGRRTVLGSMTVADVAEVYGMTVEDVKRCLDLPPGVTGADSMGRLRRALGFTMREVEERLERPSRGAESAGEIP